MELLYTVGAEGRPPERKNDEDFGIDLFASEDTLIVPDMLHSTLVPTELRVAFPKEYGMKLNIRSGISSKLPLVLANGTGLIDCGFRNQIMISLRNTFASYQQTDTHVLHLKGKEIVRTSLDEVKTSSLLQAKEKFIKSAELVGITIPDNVKDQLFKVSVPRGTVLIKRHDKIAQFHMQESLPTEMNKVNDGELPDSIRQQKGFGDSGSN